MSFPCSFQLSRYNSPRCLANMPLQPKNSVYLLCCQPSVNSCTLTRALYACQGCARSVDGSPASTAPGEGRRRQEGQDWWQLLKQTSPGTAVEHCASPPTPRYSACIFVATCKQGASCCSVVTPDLAACILACLVDHSYTRVKVEHIDTRCLQNSKSGAHQHFLRVHMSCMLLRRPTAMAHACVAAVHRYYPRHDSL